MEKWKKNNKVYTPSLSFETPVTAPERRPLQLARKRTISYPLAINDADDNQDNDRRLLSPSPPPPMYTVPDNTWIVKSKKERYNMVADDEYTKNDVNNEINDAPSTSVHTVVINASETTTMEPEKLQLQHQETSS